MTYLSAAESLRELDGYADFTGEPLAHFPPIFPILLAPGGRSLGWAVLVGAAAAVVVATFLFRLLAARVDPPTAFVGTLVYVVSQASVQIGSTVWSETPYLAFALATIYVSTRPTLTVGSAAFAGTLAGLGFLTRYSGAGLIVTGFVAIAVMSRRRGSPSARVSLAAYLAPPALLAVGWVTRNLVSTGEPFGPHFEGGAGESLPLLVRRLNGSLGRLIVDLHGSNWLTRPIGYVALAALAIGAVTVLRNRERDVTDIAMLTFAFTSTIVPTVSRSIAGTDLSARLVSPTLVPLVYFAVLAANYLRRSRMVLAVAVAMAALSLSVGLLAVVDAPDRRAVSADVAGADAAPLYERVGRLPAEANVVTNSPHRVWWHTGRVPTLFAFTVPRAGNSHFPLSPSDTVALACDDGTYLAWFPTLANAGGAAPNELRPDLADLILLRTVESGPGGAIYRLEPRKSSGCAD